MNMLLFLKTLPRSDLTIIPDGDNQALVSEEDGQIFTLNVGDRTEIDGQPLLTFANGEVVFSNAGIAVTTGDTATISVEGEGGLVANFPSGVILSQETAIDLLGDDGEIVNKGLIAGELNGVRLVGDGGKLINRGDVESDSRAVEIIGSDIEIVNEGDVFGTGDQRNGTVYANSTAEDYVLRNSKNGRIDAGFGNDGAGISFEVGDEAGESVDIEIVNHGSIAGRGDAPLGENTRGDGIRLFSSVDGGTTYDGEIINRGFITSDFARGIELRDGLGFSGLLFNSGAIFGATDGLYLGDAEHDARVVNTGFIASDSRAVNIDGSDVEVVNRGQIYGTGDQRNGTVYSDATAEDYRLVNAKSGIIDAGKGNNGAGVVFQIGDEPGDTVEAEIINRGLVQGRGDVETGNLAGDGIRLFSGSEGLVAFLGGIVNTGTILASQDGIDVNATEAAFGFVGDIDNRGTVEAGDDGIKIDDNTAFAGDVRSSGTIKAGDNGIEFGANATFAGDIRNSGQIEAEVDGIQFDSGTNSAGEIRNSGSIDAGQEGIEIDQAASFAGDIRNSGTIAAGDDGIEIDDGTSFIGDIVNTGEVRGEMDGIDVQPGTIVAGDIVNRGVIEGVAAAGIDLGAAAFTGDILNRGEILGGEDGIEVDDGVSFAGRVVNGPDALIDGDFNGIELANVADGPKIVNNGTVQSDSRAINLDGTDVELVNNASILGSGDQRNGTVYANSTAEDYRIVNDDGGVIDAGLGNDGSGVSLQTGDADGDVVVASLTNRGTIEGRGEADLGNTIGDGVRLFSDVLQAVWQGDIENEGRIAGAQDSAAAVGIRIEDGVTLDGKIANSGTIVGAEVAVDASQAGGDVKVFNDGQIEGDVVLSEGDDVFDGNGGSLDGRVEGNGGNDTIVGSGSEDVLAGGAGDDELTGGGDADTFVFGSSDAPSFDTITDFQDGTDLLDVSDFGFSSAADIAVSELGGDTVLTFAPDNHVTLIDVEAAAIGDDDFIF